MILVICFITGMAVGACLVVVYLYAAHILPIRAVDAHTRRHIESCHDIIGSLRDEAAWLRDKLKEAKEKP